MAVIVLVFLVLLPAVLIGGLFVWAALQGFADAPRHPSPDEDEYRLCYIRGPEGILIGLAEQIG